MSSLDVAQNMTELEKEFREVKKKIDQFNDSRNDDVEVLISYSRACHYKKI